MSELSPTRPDLSDRHERLKFKMAQARQELLATLQNLTPAQLELPTRNEGWSVGQVAAHIAGAEGGMEVIAQRILAQDPQQRETAAGLDIDRYNASMLRRRVGKSIPELQAELEASRSRMLAFLERVGEADLDLPGLHPAYGETTLYGLFVIIYKHERIHTEDIQQALAQAEERNLTNNDV